MCYSQWKLVKFEVISNHYIHPDLNKKTKKKRADSRIDLENFSIIVLFELSVTL